MSSITQHREGRRDAVVGERDAEFTAFYRAEYPALVRTLYLVVRDLEQARDLAQEAFVQMFPRWRRISRYERPDAWVRRVGIHMALRMRWREQRRPLLERELEFGTLTRPIDIDVVRAIGQLPASQRAAVALFYLEDRPVHEVAEILACTRATAKVHLHRARKRLVELLSETESELESQDAD